MANTFLRRLVLRTVVYRQLVYSSKSRSTCIISRKASQQFQSRNFILPACCIQITSTTRYYSKQNVDLKNNEQEKKLPIFARFKQMYRDYWYVLVPVHLVTSAAWFGGFYYLAKSGVDLVGILESFNISERIINPLKDSSMGYLAISYALYKLATPLRYTVTLGGTTISINYLKQWGYIKPVPSKDKLKELYTEKKDNIIETVRERKEEIKDRKDNLLGDLGKSLEKFKTCTGNLKAEKENVGIKSIQKNKCSKNH